MPDLRFVSTYDINGIGSHLDGGPNSTDNAFASLASNQYHNWSLGLRADIPLGFRDAHSAVRVARLRLAQSYGILQDQEYRAQRYLAAQYQKLAEFYELIRAQRAQREAAAVQLDARSKEYDAGRGTLDFLLLAQREWANALQGEYAAIVNYNNTLARFEFAKGTIMEHDNVHIGEGPLPQCAQVRAVEHERQRAKALVLHERANPVFQPPCDYEQGMTGLPELPAHSAPSLPSLFEGKDKSIAPASYQKKASPSHLPALSSEPPMAGQEISKLRKPTSSEGPVLPALDVKEALAGTARTDQEEGPELIAPVNIRVTSVTAHGSADGPVLPLPVNMRVPSAKALELPTEGPELLPADLGPLLIHAN